MSGLTRGGLGLAAALGVLALAPCPATASPNTLCTLRPGTSALPPGARHGLAHHLRQYPELGLATAAQVHTARRLLARIRAATRAYASTEVAAAHGFDTDLARRAPGDLAVGYLHAEHRRNSADRHVLDPARPESLIYATEPGRRPRLIGAMFSVARGVLGPTPAGPIARWHAHLVCRQGDKRGLAPPSYGACPPGSELRQGSEMLHVWFTTDLRSAFAVHAPAPELCRDGMLSAKACAAGAPRREM